MSLMLDALRRIEAKQAPAPARETAEPIAWPSGTLPVEQIVSPSAVSSVDQVALPPADWPVEQVALPPVAEVSAPPADALPSMPLDNFTSPEPFSMDATIDRLQAFVCEAGLLYDFEPAFNTGNVAEPGFDTCDGGKPEFDASDDAAPKFEIGESGETVLDAGEGEDAKAEFNPSEDTEPVSAVMEAGKAEFETGEAEAALPVVTPVAFEPHAATAQQILRQLPEGRSQTLLFTSPADGQGKTMTLARLAPFLAQGIEGSVLVVDANFRNPDMAERLAVVPTWRLPDVLAGDADWSTAVQTTAYERVSLLPGGSDAQGWEPGGKVQDMRQLLGDLAGHYDLVVVDASSLAHRGTAQLAAACDATYLVVRLGEGSPRMVREAAQVVERNGGQLLGCVAIDAGA